MKRYEVEGRLSLASVDVLRIDYAAKDAKRSTDLFVKRFYCHWTGSGVEMKEGELCPNCGAKSHWRMPGNWCGNFIPISSTSGEICDKEVDHEGPCEVVKTHCLTMKI